MSTGMVGCGNMDGEIDSGRQHATELPSENNQSNFGTGYELIREGFGEGQLIVNVDGEIRVIFRDTDSTWTLLFRADVLHFTAKR